MLYSRRSFAAFITRTAALICTHLARDVMAPHLLCLPPIPSAEKLAGEGKFVPVKDAWLRCIKVNWCRLVIAFNRAWPHSLMRPTSHQLNCWKNSQLHNILMEKNCWKHDSLVSFWKARCAWHMPSGCILLVVLKVTRAYHQIVVVHMSAICGCTGLDEPTACCPCVYPFT